MSTFLEIEAKEKRIFAIGDLHGCSAELSVLVEHLKSSEKLSKEDILIFIGDYIDRGLNSKSVIDQLVKIKKEFPEAVFLKGNHETMFLDFLGFEGTLGGAWLKNGGNKTLESYGINVTTKGQEVSKLLPSEHLRFFLSLERYVLTEDFAFVHAGFNPLRDIRSQLDEDIFWIRDEFLMNTHRFNKLVVFGHTPYKSVFSNLPYKLGIDTGLVYGNKLTCVVLPEKKIIDIKLNENVPKDYIIKT